MTDMFSAILESRIPTPRQNDQKKWLREILSFLDHEDQICRSKGHLLKLSGSVQEEDIP